MSVSLVALHRVVQVLFFPADLLSSFQSIISSGTLKPLTITIIFFPFISVSFCFVYFGALLLDT